MTVMVMLSEITHGKKETFGGYIDQFTEEVVVVGGLDKSLMWWIFEKSFKPNCVFQEKLGCKEANNMKDFFSRAQSYIIYGENIVADGGSWVPRNTVPGGPYEKDFRWSKEESKHSPTQVLTHIFSWMCQHEI